MLRDLSRAKKALGCLGLPPDLRLYPSKHHLCSTCMKPLIRPEAKPMTQPHSHRHHLRRGGAIMIIAGSLGIAHSALGVATTTSAPLSASLADMPPPHHHLQPLPPTHHDYGPISGLWGYALRLLGEGLVVEGAMEALIWAIDADCVLMCGSSEQHQLIRAIRLAQYQAIDMLDGKEDGLYNGVLVGFTDEWLQRDRSLEQAILLSPNSDDLPRNGSAHQDHLQAPSQVQTHPD